MAVFSEPTFPQHGDKTNRNRYSRTWTRTRRRRRSESGCPRDAVLHRRDGEETREGYEGRGEWSLRGRSNLKFGRYKDATSFGSPCLLNLPFACPPILSRCDSHATMNATPSSLPSPPHLNGDSVPDHSPQPASSPRLASPATPVSTAVVADAKIDIDTHEQESDARHEPTPVSINKLDCQSMEPVIDIDLREPLCPLILSRSPALTTNSRLAADGPVPASPSPSVADENVSESPATNVGEDKLAEDVQMGEPETQGHPNGDVGLDHPMDVQTSVFTSDPSSVPAPTSSNTIDSNAVSTSYTTPRDSCPNDDDVQPPPAKRPRMHSDADQASLANVSPPCPVRLSRRANIVLQVRHPTSSLGLILDASQRSNASQWQWRRFRVG